MRASAVFAICLLAPFVSAENASTPSGDPVLEHPTLHCLGAYWIIKGDDNANAVVAVEYRKAGDADWKKGPPLFRVEKGAHIPPKGKSKIDLPEGAWLFAGSIFILDPNTAYEMKLTLSDPDGGSAEKTLSAKTAAEPVAPKDARVRHVAPGSGGGTGTEADPFKGLTAAQAEAQPGDLFLLQPGIYEGAFTIEKSGEPGKPIIWRGNGKGEVILDGQGKAAERPERVISAGGCQDVWFEKLTLRNGNYGIVAHDSARIVMRRCHVLKCDYALTATRNDKGVTNGFFITDNLFEGPCTWPREKGIESPRGVQISGLGHVVAYNRVHGYADAIDTFPSPSCAAIDFHNNDCSECTDDGIEMDYSERNTRCFYNRLTNIFQGITTQPIYGGPVYIFRNAMYNVVGSPFKMHNRPSGAIMIHNTVLKSGRAMEVYSGADVVNCIYRNNVFIGTTDRYCFESTSKMINCDFDYDGFGGVTFEKFMKWNKVIYDTIEDVRKNAPVEKHAVWLDVAKTFASGAKAPEEPKAKAPVSVNDLRLREGSAAIDAGEVLPCYNDGFKGKAPDLGAYEFGGEVPHYGPRPEK